MTHVPPRRGRRLVAALVAVVAAPLLSSASSPAEAAPDGGWFPTNDRAAVLAAYDEEFGLPVPGTGWTGSVDGCQAGATRPVFRAAVFDRINWFRKMAGVHEVSEDPAASGTAQRTALMMSAANDVSHSPGPGWPCGTQEGQAGAARSNLFIGVHGPNAISGYVFDPGASNAPVGHRRWVLHPPAVTMGTGDVPATPGHSAANALYVMGATDDARREVREAGGFVAWPPRGHIPADLVPDRWSFSKRGADFSGAGVAMWLDGQPLPVDVVHRNGGFGDPTIVWVPRFDVSSVQHDAHVVVHVAVGGVTHGYDVLVADVSSAPNRRFVAKAYADFLGRAVDAPAQEHWASHLDAGAVSRRHVADVLSESDEWAGAVVEDFYQQTYGRPADADGKAYWLRQLRQGVPVASVAANFYANDEYRARFDSATAWIRDLYQRMLGRSPGQGEVDHWRSQLGRGRSFVALGIYQSFEGRARRVDALYEDLLGRRADAGGRHHWAGVLADGDDLALATHLAASQEYFLTP